MLKALIDNRAVSVDGGRTILDSAREAGISIPSLCHLDGSNHTTSCMICLVHEKSTGKFLPACATVLAEGMEVETDNGPIRQMRKAALELLLSEHNGKCHTCVKHESCQLKKLARDYHANQHRYPDKSRQVIPLKVDYGRVIFDPGKCIKCCRCVHISERSGIRFGPALLGRGYNGHIGIPFGQSLDQGFDEIALECVNLCPTGALVRKETEFFII
jgi:NADH dehydrogenase/NADH:ubiquinone oxidoreductase subunit G